MSFEVAASAYARFMGRYADPLALAFAPYAGVVPGQRVLDVGCGPGTLTAVLVPALGAEALAGIDPSPPFVAAARERFPGVDVRQGVAERLPWHDDVFDAALAQLVVHFMADPVAGLREMARVTRPGGTVAACVWDHGGGEGPLSLFWRVVAGADPEAPAEGGLPGTREGQLAALATDAGWHDVEDGRLTVTIAFTGFDDWWEPYTFGVGPAGEYVAGLEDEAREDLRARCAAELPDGPFERTSVAWAVRGHA